MRASWTGEARVAVGDIMAARTMTPHRIDALAGHTRAFVQVQNGCDHRCTFCIIPFGRGNSRSLPIERRGGAGARARPSAAIAKWCSPASISPAMAMARRGWARWSSAS